MSLNSKISREKRGRPPQTPPFWNSALFEKEFEEFMDQAPLSKLKKPGVAQSLGISPAKVYFWTATKGKKLTPTLKEAEGLARLEVELLDSDLIATATKWLTVAGWINDAKSPLVDEAVKRIEESTYLGRRATDSVDEIIASITANTEATDDQARLMLASYFSQDVHKRQVISWLARNREGIITFIWHWRAGTTKKFFSENLYAPLRDLVRRHIDLLLNGASEIGTGGSHVRQTKVLGFVLLDYEPEAGTREKLIEARKNELQEAIINSGFVDASWKDRFSIYIGCPSRPCEHLADVWFYLGPDPFGIFVSTTTALLRMALAHPSFKPNQGWWAAQVSPFDLTNSIERIIGFLEHRGIETDLSFASVEPANKSEWLQLTLQKEY